MIKKNFCLFLLILISVSFTSCAREKIIKGDGNPDIDEILICEVKNSTENDDNFYYPKFEIRVNKKADVEILEYELQYQYIFGQDWNILFNERKLYKFDSKEISLLNKDGSFAFEYELEKIPVEKEYDPSSYSGELNYNEVVVISCYVKYRK